MRVILTLLLMLAAAPAWAEWTKATEDDDAVHYTDPATLGKDGNLRTVGTLQDLKKKGPQGEMSRRANWEYDCAEKRGRLLSFSLHSGPMATGETLRSGSTPRELNYITPGSTGEALYKIACAR
jgi:hypothetical protein